ncbi:hypothetical protein EROM_080420 [Encephalitozoon romaleae SJ-2008]|uniref:Ubiquitin-like domain-containing protein n=1 Tax=Encephalitozoon romaleae (strain SJ-2008) TaxID=1178016 RepID=I7ANU5_ENCRO|nr:hypothetical protein EROM_080420 [Encephalitozoon romaleae SJ-2008]AFN83464.1 hypothetical protein EROM_080420 [Encephalitozoon romaleae SJ-2008]
MIFFISTIILESMGDDSSDEIVLAERMDNDSSEISMVEVVRKYQRPTRVKRKGSTQSSQTSKARRRQGVEKAQYADDLSSREPGSDFCEKKELCKVTVVDQNSKKTFHMKKTDTLESIYKAYHEGSSPIKMKYKSVPVSRHLTLEEIGFDGDHCITIHRQGQASGEFGIELKIHVDCTKTIEVNLCKELMIEEVFEKLEEMGFRGDLLVRNGVVLGRKMNIKDVLQTGDVVDLVSKDEIEYKI